MAVSALVRRCRSAAPLVAFFATALLAIVLAAQAQLVCSHEMIVTMPAMDMPGMAMGRHGMAMGEPRSLGSAIALCPIVLILGAAAAVLCASALALLLVDEHRASSSRALVRACTRLPLLGTVATIIAFGSIAVGVMMAVDRNTPAGAAGWLSLIALVISIAVALTVLAIGAAKCALSLTERIAVAIALAIDLLRPAVPVRAYARCTRRAQRTHRVPALAARRGLRAPPFSVR